MIEKKQVIPAEHKKTEIAPDFAPDFTPEYVVKSDHEISDKAYLAELERSRKEKAEYSNQKPVDDKLSVSSSVPGNRPLAVNTSAEADFMPNMVYQAQDMVQTEPEHRMVSGSQNQQNPDFTPYPEHDFQNMPEDPVIRQTNPVTQFEPVTKPESVMRPEPEPLPAKEKIKTDSQQDNPFIRVTLREPTPDDIGVSRAKRNTEGFTEKILSTKNKDVVPDFMPFGAEQDVSGRQTVVLKSGQKLYRTKNALKDVLATPAESAKQVIEQDDSEGMHRARYATRTTADVISEIGSRENVKDAIKSMRKEAGRYIAGDMLFHNGDKRGVVGAYVEKNGCTPGVIKSYYQIAKNPEKFYINGTMTLDEMTVMSCIRSYEKYATNADGEVVKDDSGEPVIQKVSGKKGRMFQKKIQSMFSANTVESEMRSHMNIYTKKEKEILKINNKIFDFKSLDDITKAAKMTDKLIVQYAKELSGMGVKLELSKIFGNDELDVSALHNATKKQIKDFIKQLDEIKVPPAAKDTVKALKESLKMKNELKSFEDRIRRKLGNVNIMKSGLMMIGGKELMDSDFGTSYRLVATGAKTTATAVKAGYHTARFSGHAAKKAVRKAADTVAPEQMMHLDEFGIKTKGQVSDAWKEAKKDAVKAIRETKPVKTLRNGITSIKSAGKEASEAMADTTLGKIWNKLGKLFDKYKDPVKKAGGVVTTIVSAPFKALNNAMNFVKKNIMIPGAIVIGVIFALLTIFSSAFSGESANETVVVAIMSDEDQLLDFQNRYDALDATFEAQVNGIINGYASTKNLKGDAIRYGINTAEATVQGYGNTTNPSIQDMTIPSQYAKGVTMHYTYDGTETSGISSNIEDCLSALAVIMMQSQSEHRSEALELLEAIYKSTHSYTVMESALYDCTEGCVLTHFNCNEWKLNYPSSNLKFGPWRHEIVYIPDSTHECVVCRAGIHGEVAYEDYTGCTVTGTCYHGEDGDMGESHENCDNYTTVYDCPGHEDEDADGNKYTYTCPGPLGCEGYYECLGHNHYGCPTGHDIRTCYGHVNLDMTVNIASLDKIFEMGGVGTSGGGNK